MNMNKSVRVQFSPDDLQDLQEFLAFKTKKAAANYSLKEASDLIHEARREIKTERERGFEIQQRDQIARDQRDSISRLDDRNAAAQEKIFIEDAKAQGREYAVSKNSGKSGRAYITEDDKSILQGVTSWIERQRKRGNLGGQKALRK